MNKAALILLALLAGCESTTTDEIEAAERYCAPHGGLREIPAQWSPARGTKSIVCRDGAEALMRYAANKEQP